MKNLIAVCLCTIASLASAQEIARVAEPADVQRLTNELRRSVQRLLPNASIRECRPVVHAFVGRQNEIFGGYCSVSIGDKPHKLLICDDLMIGMLTISGAYDNVALFPDWEPHADLVVDFVARNCTP